MMDIIVFFGPGGAGKNYLLEEIKDKFDIPELLSFTTRDMRKGESQGSPYNFISKEEAQKIDTIEMAKRGDNYYGVSMREFEKKTKGEEMVSVIVDEEGIKEYKENFGNAVTTFYIYCHPQEAYSRMLSRGDDIKEAKKRVNYDLQNGEYRNFDLADFTIHNHDNCLFEVIKRIENIIKLMGRK